MSWLILMFVAYGLSFGFSNKLPERFYFTKDGDPAEHFFARMSRCAYCTGFWMAMTAKGLSWASAAFSGGSLPANAGEVISTLLIYGMSGAAFCYLFHCITLWLENTSALAESRFDGE
jgi:hypothetical protein